MKTSFLTAAALAGVLAMSGCAAASQGASPTDAPSAAASVSAAPTMTAVAQPAAPAAAPQSTEGKAHFAGDYKKATPAETAKVVELSKQWYSPEKESALKAKMAGAGLASSIPQEQADQGWYAKAAAVCQVKFDGVKIPAKGAFLEISQLITSTYCPEVG